MKFILITLALATLSAFAEIKDVSALSIQKLLDTKSAPTILDIRTPEEFKQLHLKNALNVNFKSENFAQELAKLDKSKPYILHCKSGGRSTKALALMKKLGFTNVLHMKGGIDEWNRLPVTCKE